MKALNLLLAVALLFGLAASNDAWSDRGHHGGSPGVRFHHNHRLGVVVAAPLFYPWWYSWPAPYYPPAPQSYIERGDASGYWYYCENPTGYFPYIKECLVGWTKVVPTPPPPTQ